MLRIAVVALGLCHSIKAQAAELLSAKAACQMAHAPEKQMGQTIRFYGSYAADRERAVITPTGCDRRIGVGAIAPEPERLLQASVDPLKPFVEIEAEFTATFSRVAPNSMVVARDKGFRLDVSEISNLRVIEP